MNGIGFPIFTTGVERTIDCVLADGWETICAKE